MNLDENNPATRSQSISYIYKMLFEQFKGLVYFVIGPEKVPLKTFSVNLNYASHCVIYVIFTFVHNAL